MSDEDLTTFADVERETNNQIRIDIGTHYTPPPVVNRYSLRLEKENNFILMFKPCVVRRHVECSRSGDGKTNWLGSDIIPKNDELKTCRIDGVTLRKITICNGYYS